MRRLAFALVLLMTFSTVAAAAPGVLRARMRAPYDHDRLLTIMVVGSDVGGPDRPGNPLKGRADALHLIAVDTRRATATVVDIPRDSVIGGDKVNAHLAVGGPKRLRYRLEQYTNLNIDHYVVTSFSGMRRMVRAFGGVSVTVDRRVRDRKSNANLRPGYQRLTGRQALAYSRARKTLRNGDFDRTRHQGDLLIAAQHKLRRRQPTLLELSRLVASFSRNTESDISTQNVFRLAELASRIKPSNIKQVSLRGGIGSRGGSSVVYLYRTDVFRDIKRRRLG